MAKQCFVSNESLPRGRLVVTTPSSVAVPRMRYFLDRSSRLDEPHMDKMQRVSLPISALIL
jgi:hypothetical protein